MKNLVIDNGTYKVFAEVNEYLRSNGNVELKFSSLWEDAKNSDEFQTKFRLILTPDQRKILKDLL